MNYNNLAYKNNEQSIRLKPLWLVCYPESGEFLEPEIILQVNEIEIPDVFVSYSAYENGWYKKFLDCNKFNVFNYLDLDKVICKLNIYDLLIVAPLSLNSLAKFSLGIQDSIPSKLFGNFVNLGKPVLLETSQIPEHERKVNPHFYKIYKRYIQELIGGTIIEFKISNFVLVLNRILKQRRQIYFQNKLSESIRNVITKEDVLNAYNAMLPIIVNSKTIITPLALEEADRLGVEIKFES